MRWIKRLEMNRVKKNKRVFKLYYFNSKPNFGDLLNVDIFNRMFNIQTQYSAIRKSNIVAIGSLFELLFSSRKSFFRRIFYPKIIVWGTGFMYAEKGKLYPKRRFKIYAVRGYLTLERLKKYGIVNSDAKISVGDPGLLASKLIDTSKIKKKYDLGIIPHYVDKGNPLLENIKVKNSVVLDITKNPIELLHDIAECKTIISSAMHGLIAADSLGIPNIRMILSDKITGGDYKFNDYYSVYKIDKHPRIVLNESTKIIDTDFITNNYKITRHMVNKINNDLISSLMTAMGYKNE